MLLVSHDRAFIDAVCPDILELDGVGGAHRHRGGYAAYLEGREERWQVEARTPSTFHSHTTRVFARQS